MVVFFKSKICTCNLCAFLYKIKSPKCKNANIVCYWHCWLSSRMSAEYCGLSPRTIFRGNDGNEVVRDLILNVPWRPVCQHLSGSGERNNFKSWGLAGGTSVTGEMGDLEGLIPFSFSSVGCTMPPQVQSNRAKQLWTESLYFQRFPLVLCGSDVL